MNRNPTKRTRWNGKNVLGQKVVGQVSFDLVTSFFIATFQDEEPERNEFETRMDEFFGKGSPQEIELVLTREDC